MLPQRPQSSTSGWRTNSNKYTCILNHIFWICCFLPIHLRLGGGHESAGQHSSGIASISMPVTIETSSPPFWPWSTWFLNLSCNPLIGSILNSDDADPPEAALSDGAASSRTKERRDLESSPGVASPYGAASLRTTSPGTHPAALTLTEIANIMFLGHCHHRILDWWWAWVPFPHQQGIWAVAQFNQIPS